MRVQYEYVDDEGGVADLGDVNDEMIEYAKNTIGMSDAELGPKIEHIISYTGCFIIAENRSEYRGYIPAKWIASHMERYNHMTMFPDKFIQVMHEFLANRYDFVVETWVR